MNNEVYDLVRSKAAAELKRQRRALAVTDTAVKIRHCWRWLKR